MKHSSVLDTVWAARIEMRARVDTKEYKNGYRGAFATVLVRCDSGTEFMSAVTELVADEGFDVVNVENLAPLSAGNFEMNEMMMDLFRKTSGYPVQWTTFHLYRA